MNYPILLLALVCNQQNECDYFVADRFQEVEDCKHDLPLFDFTYLKSQTLRVIKTKCVIETEEGEFDELLEDQ